MALPLAASLLIPTPADFAGVAAECILVAGVCAVLLTPFFTATRTNLIASVAATLAVGGALLVTFLAPAAPGSVFAGMLNADAAALFWRRLVLVFMLGVLAIRWPRSNDDPGRDDTVDCTLLLSATLGMTLMGASQNLLLILLASEIASVPGYLLAGVRKHERQAAEASLKFVLFGAVSTAIMIYGISLLYGVAHSFDFGVIAHHLATAGASPLAMIGLIGLLIGLLFKLSAVPMHFWAPDVFEGGGVDVAAFLSVASKGAGVVLTARLAYLIAGAGGSTVHGMRVTLAIVAVATMTVGNVAAVPQTSVKRMLAYSSIAQGGYMLATIALLGPAGLSATAIYLLIYTIMNLGAFAVLAAVQDTRGHDRIDAFDGLSRAAPAAAAAMAVCLIGLVGLPPAAGFFAKWKIMSALAAGGGWWWAVVAAVAVNSVISLAYYARVIRAMYLRPGEEVTPLATSPAVAVGVVCAAAMVAMLIFFALVERMSGTFVF